MKQQQQQRGLVRLTRRIIRLENEVHLAMAVMFICLVRPKKAEPNRMRFRVGGKRINYPGKVATPTSEMLVAKMLFNSVISTKGGMIHDNGHFQLLPHDTSSLCPIHPNQDK